MKNQIIKQSQNIAEKPKTVTDEVLERVRELQASKELVIPENYAAQNALKSAYLILQETKDKNTGLPSLQFAGFICFREDYDKVLADDEAGLI